MSHPLYICNKGLIGYKEAWQSMKTYTHHRDDKSPDQVWWVQHPPVFTQGLNGKEEHIIHSIDNIPVIASDRGGQVTYHGPGQLIIYLLIDLKRRKLGVRQLVTAMENAVIKFLQDFDVQAQANPQAPGVYVNGAKIASLGLKIRKQRCYHGIAINVDMDMAPFNAINPCGLLNQTMTQLSEWVNPLPDHLSLYQQITQHFANELDLALELSQDACC